MTEGDVESTTGSDPAGDGTRRPDSDAVPMPVVEGPLVLPLNKISPERFEQLSRSLVERMPDVRVAHRYGTAGQAQDGIDLYAEFEDGSVGVYQCRRYETMGPADIRSAVQDYRKGSWFAASTRFSLWTSADLRPTTVDAELRKQKAELAADGRVFDWMGLEELSARAAAHPDIVRTVFGDAWTKAAAGSSQVDNDVAASLRRHGADEVRKRTLPPGVRHAINRTNTTDLERILSTVELDSPKDAVEGLVRLNPPWVQNAPSQVLLALGELCESFNLPSAAGRLFLAAADGGLDRAFLYARAALAALAANEDQRVSDRLALANAAGGGSSVRMIEAAVANRPDGILASMSAVEALTHPKLAMLYAKALQRSSDDSAVIPFLTTAVSSWPEFSGFMLELGWELERRAQSLTSPNRALDRTSAIDLALTARTLRREWRGDASEAVHLACMSALMAGRYELALRYGQSAPAGEALPAEAANPDVRQAVLHALEALGRLDEAKILVNVDPGTFQAALLDAQMLQASGSGSTVVAQAFVGAWGRASTEQERVALWFAAAHAGVEPLPGSAELDARNDDMTILVRAHVEIAAQRFDEAIRRLRLRPDNEGCVRTLAHALAMSGRVDDAVDELERAAARFNEPDHLYAASRLLTEHHRTTEATRVADQALLRLAPTLEHQRGFCYQIGIRAAEERGAWQDMALRVRAWIQDQGATDTRRWLLVRALHNQHELERAWSVMNDAPVLRPHDAVSAQLWIVVSSNFRPSNELTVEILDVHDQYAHADRNVTRAATNAFVNMGPDKGELDESVVARYQALFAKRAADAADNADDTFFTIEVPDDAEGLIESLRPHLEPGTRETQDIAERVALGWPYGALAYAAGRPYTTTLVHRAAGCLPIETTVPALRAAEREVARRAHGNNVVIDISTFVIARYLGDLWPLIRQHVGRIETPSLALDDALRAVDALSPRPAGYLGWDARTKLPVFTDASLADLDRIDADIKWIATALKPLAVHDVPTNSDPQMTAFRDTPWMAAINLARDRNAFLWADDLGLRFLAREAGVPTFGTVAFIRTLLDQGQLTSIQHETAIATLRNEYCVDLDHDPQWLRQRAAQSPLPDGPGMLALTRPSMWTDMPAAIDLWRELISTAATADTSLVAQWTYAASRGLARISSGLTTPIVAALICDALVATRFEPTALRDCVSAGRLACYEQNAADPFPTAIKALFVAISGAQNAAVAASLISARTVHLDSHDRQIVRSILFDLAGHSPDERPS